MIEIVTILQGFGISLGVGASTLAVSNFFVAIWDGHIDEHERKMMGVTYIVLRVAMTIILLSTLISTIFEYNQTGQVSLFTVQVITLICLLFFNAALMTLHYMPMTFGPAIQASAWYTLGLLSLFRLVEWSLDYTIFVLMYITIASSAFAVINFLLLYCKSCQKKKGICI